MASLLPLEWQINISLPRGLRTLNKTWCDEAMKSLQSRGNHDDLSMKLVFMVVLMAITGSILYISGFMNLFFPKPQIGFRSFLRRFNLIVIARFVLNFSFFQFVPLLSSAFSQSRASQDQNHNNMDLPLILMWMLLVEIIHKKVQGMLMPTDGSSFSRGIGRFTLKDYSFEFSYLVWVGYLIYSNLEGLKSPWLVIIFITLWSLCFTKLVLSVVNRWLASDSLHTARNPLVIAGYMQKVMETTTTVNENGKLNGDVSSATATGKDDMMMSTFKFVVMGEDRLVLDKKARRKKRQEAPDNKPVTTHGYGYGVGRRVVTCQQQKAHHFCDQSEQKHAHIHIDGDDRPSSNKEKKLVVTVGDVWKMHEEHPNLFYGKRGQILEDLCLSFSLFKMLRRRFEHYPMVEVGSGMVRKLMLDGLLQLKDHSPKGKLQTFCFKLLGGKPNDKKQSQRPFQVLLLELELLESYYQQAAAPVVMSQPILFVANAFSSLVFVVIFIDAFIFILFLDEDIAPLYCLVMGWTNSPLAFPSVTVTMTILLLFTVIAIELHEFWTLYVLSNWNMVRMVCFFCSSQSRKLLRRICFLIISVRFSTFYLSKNKMSIYQVSIFDACGPVDKYIEKVRQVTLPASATARIIDALRSDDTVSPSTGIVSLPPVMTAGLDFHNMTTTEIILACHLATELLDMKVQVEWSTALPLPLPPPPPATKTAKKKGEEEDHRKVASMLSKYCMFLVVELPELLPDDETWVSERYEDMRSCLDAASRWCFGVVSPPRRRCRKRMIAKAVRSGQWRESFQDPTARSGAELLHWLKGKPSVDEAWAELARFWVHLLIYLAPSNDVQGHAKTLASWGGDLITCLWAFSTHAGITRQPPDQPDELPIVHCDHQPFSHDNDDIIV